MIYGHSLEVYGLKLITAPTIEPLSLTETKLHLRLDTTTDDSLVGSLITAARELVEQVTGRAMITQTWEMTLDAFPYPRSYMTGTRPVGGILPVQRIRVPKPNLQSVTSVKYLDMSGATVTLDPSQYVVDTTSLPGQIAPAYGVAWPYSLRVPGSVTVRFVCGYVRTEDSWSALHAFPLYSVVIDSNNHLQKVTVAGTSGASAPAWNAALGTTTDGSVTWTDQGAVSPVPEALRAAMKLLVGGWYEHRESIVDSRFAQTIPFTVDALLGPYRVMEAA